VGCYKDDLFMLSYKCGSVVYKRLLILFQLQRLFSTE
jgi:hypothetical protein